MTIATSPDRELRPALPSPEDLSRLLLIRHFERALLRLFEEGAVSGTTHTCLGQEYIPVSLTPLLRDSDHVFSNHRGHGHFLARYAEPEALLAEIMGREGAVNGGIGGSQHVYHRRFMSTGVQGESLPVAVGVAASLEDGALACAYIGDGTWGEGAVYEALNMASLWSAPLLVIVENNGIAQTTPTSSQLSGTIAARAAAFGVRHTTIRTTDLTTIRTTLAPLIAATRAGEGPLIVEFVTHRLGPHSKGDDTRSATEIAEARAHDWYDGLPDHPDFAAADERVASEMTALVSKVASLPPASTLPRIPATQPTAYDHELARPTRPGLRPFAGDGSPGLPPRVVEHLNSSLHALMAADPGIHILGEDLIDPYGGAFKVTKGLSTKFPGRIRSTPLSEGGIVGVGTGMALTGRKAIIEMMFGDFVALAFDQIANFAAKSTTMYGRHVPIPLVVRCPSGGGRGYGPTHSQTLMKHFIGVPGLALYEMTPFHDAASLFAEMFASGTPSLLFEDKVLYTRRMCPDGRVDDVFRYTMTDGVARVFTDGDPTPDITLVTHGGSVHSALAAMRALLLEEDVICDLIVPARLHPLPDLPLRDDVRRLCVVEDGTEGGTWGAEVARLLYPRLWGRLAGPITLVSSADAIIPAAPHLERDVLVGEAQIRAALTQTLETHR